MNTEKFPLVELWLDDDGLIANHKGDEYKTYAETFGENRFIMRKRSEFIITACNSYHAMYEALKEALTVLDEGDGHVYELVKEALNKANKIN